LGCDASFTPLPSLQRLPPTGCTEAQRQHGRPRVPPASRNPRLGPGTVGDAEPAADDVVARFVDARTHGVGDQARVVLVEGEALAFLGEAERAATRPPLAGAPQREARFDRDIDVLDQRREDRAGVEPILVAVDADREPPPLDGALEHAEI